MRTLPLLTLALTTSLTLAACMPATNNGQTNSSMSSASATSNPNISVPIPAAKPQVTSPLVVAGRARDTWAFEGSFPLPLLDGNGNEIAITPAQAQGDWMTEDFVPFIATLTFTQPTTTTGTLILEKDNPSGEPANAAQIEIPVTF